MAKVILFGGGDGGGLIIGPNGVRPIPPFDPALLHELKSLAALVKAVVLALPGESRALTSLVTKLANHAIDQLEAVVGPLDTDGGLVFQDGDGGFTCGSTGKPPIPFPWPPRISPTIEDLVAGGILERELVTLLERGKAIKIDQLLADPAAAAAEVGVKLSQRSIDQLQLLTPEHSEKITDIEGREVVEFFQRIAEDGRFLDVWTKRPFFVAQELGVTLRPGTIERIIAGGTGIMKPGSDVMLSPVVVGIVVVVIMLVPTEAGRVPLDVLDRSGLIKF